MVGPALCWTANTINPVFRQQAAALQAAAASPGLGLMVFGCEEKVPDGGGRRSYLVCHPSVFWHCDEQKSPDERCSYEVIRQGASCKLYFDLEYDRTLNPDRDGDAMVETLIEVYGAPPPREGASVCTAMSGMKRLYPSRGALTASPYPDVDAFVRELVSPGGIRCWNYFDTSELLVYDIVGFRFCRNIGRWHRSNNIIIVVSLRDACFYQKCHDPACRAFRSDSLPLPPELLAWRELADDWEPDGGGGQFPECGASDAEMLSAAALAEPATELSPVPSAQRRGTDGGADPELGRTGELSDD
ncbi:DNA-directed primase/polymerase protein [Amphibalanus amphitrite]|uniref:DNA-directed primase/polymerase protein n=1 Tax=Amphibalanus amphitrite TaxID=1232801 RepID=A0A6A4WL67_AMPAM|nr:DNA-directed primase/polymerase protein [Amphibalanus amphitrite]